VRFNRGGQLYAPWGYIAGTHPDPIEKKPFFHVEPGSIAFSFGMVGCDLHCAYCQNWLSSQVLRDRHAATPITDVSAEALVAAALRGGATSMVSTYNEPLITVEWAAHVFERARTAGLRTGIVSNGFASTHVLDYLSPQLDMAKIDLKTMEDRRYRDLGGRLQPVLDTIASLHARRVWVEVVTLLVPPGFNDSDDELDRLARFVAGVSPNLPWHVTAFHPDYHMADRASTSPDALARAAAIGRDAGLVFVYAGNLPGQLGRLEDTACPACRTTLVERRGFRVVASRIGADGRCPACGAVIPGRWDAPPPARRP